MMEITPSPLPPPQKAKQLIQRKPMSSDFLDHLEAHLVKRDGVDKLLKISRYATKIILACSFLPESRHLPRRLESFESSVQLSRRALRLGKFVQGLNALRNSHFHYKEDAFLAVLAYGGEGLYYFVEQFIWVAESGLVGTKKARILHKVSAWAELIGYLGSIGLNVRELKGISEDEACLDSSTEIAILRGEGCGEEEERKTRFREKKQMKRHAVFQDLADGLIAFADVHDYKRKLPGPILVSCAGLVSAIINTHKIWASISSDQ